MNCVSVFSVVVFPDPVPPAIMMFDGFTPHPSITSHRNAASSYVSVLFSIRSIIVSGSFLNFRIVSVGPSALMGGIVAFIRLPSSNLASSSGVCLSIFLCVLFVYFIYYLSYFCVF